MNRIVNRDHVIGGEAQGQQQATRPGHEFDNMLFYLKSLWKREAVEPSDSLPSAAEEFLNQDVIFSINLSSKFTF